LRAYLLGGAERQPATAGRGGLWLRPIVPVDCGRGAGWV
jgi:hypothetical protein